MLGWYGGVILFLVETLYVINLNSSAGQVLLCLQTALTVLLNLAKLNKTLKRQTGREMRAESLSYPKLINGNTNEYIDIYLFICI